LGKDGKIVEVDFKDAGREIRELLDLEEKALCPRVAGAGGISSAESKSFGEGVDCLASTDLHALRR